MVKIKFTDYRLQITVILFLLSLFIVHCPLSIVYAQFDVANIYDISDESIKDGDILVFDPEKGLQKASTPYDSHLFGVFQQEPQLVLRRADDSGKPVTRSGITRVNVSPSNGQIKKGDSVTSSTLPGLGIKSTEPGYIIGIALEDADETADDQIQVALGITYKDITTIPLFDFNIKMILSAIIILFAIILGLFILSRIMPKAIEAIGRNPLAKHSIEFTLIVSIIIVTVLVAASIAAAVIILRF